MRLARARPGAGQPLATVHLTGGLGAGKTTFARGFLRACGVTERVRSPTYTLLQLFELGPRTLLHLDLYRLEDPEELEPLALREWARAGCLWLIEWPERGAGFLPPPDLIVRLAAGAEAHQAELRAGTSTGEEWLKRLQAAGKEPTHG